MSRKGRVSICLLGAVLTVAAYAAVINCAANLVDNAKGKVDDAGPALAWSGKAFGMVWVTDAALDKLMFASLGADGKRSGNPRLLFQAKTDGDYIQRCPSIVWTGSSFLVVFDRAGSYCALQVGADGAVLNGPVSLKTEASMYSESSGSLAWDGNEAGFAYITQETKLCFKRVSKTGALIGKSILVTPNAGHVRFGVPVVRAAWDGRQFGVVWTTKDAKGIGYQAVSSQGALVGSRVMPAKTSGQFDDMSLCGGKPGTFGLAYTENVLNVRTVVYFTQITSGGTLIHKAVNVRSCPKTSTFVGAHPCVAWNAAKDVFHVSWEDNRVEPKPSSGVTSYLNFFMRSVKTDGKFASQETLLKAKYKETGYHIYECGVAFTGTQYCIGFIRNNAALYSGDTDNRAYSLSVTPR